VWRLAKAHARGVKLGGWEAVNQCEILCWACYQEVTATLASQTQGLALSNEVVREGKAVSSNAQIAELSEADEPVAATPPSQDRYGLAVLPLTPDIAKQLGVKDARGHVVTNVQPGSPAADVGIEVGDVIAQVNRRPVHSAAEFRQALAGLKPGDSTLFLIRRKDTSLFVAVETQKQG
jgi:predicted metalloprotease with PDZ domain